MRYDKQHKERTRQRLLAEAAAAIRAEGPEQLGVAALMSRAGLTHGGFYAHFKSKDDLVDQAVGASFDQMERRFARTIEGLPPAEGLAAHISYYLSVRHVEHRDAGCPLPALSSDMGRASGAARSRYSNGMAGQAQRIARLLEAMGLSREEAEEKARSTVSEMVGAVALARATTDPTQVEPILEASRRSIFGRLGLGDAA